MAEGQDMSVERSTLPEDAYTAPKPVEMGGALNGVRVPKINIEEPEPMDYGTDEGKIKVSFDRMLELDAVKDKIGEKEHNPNYNPEVAKIPQVPPIEFIRDYPVSGEQLVSWAQTPVVLEDGTNVGNVLENIGAKTPVPINEPGFKRVANRLFQTLLRKKVSPDAAVDTANFYIDRYHSADSATRSSILEQIQRKITHLNQEPIPARASSRKSR